MAQGDWRAPVMQPHGAAAEDSLAPEPAWTDGRSKALCPCLTRSRRAGDWHMVWQQRLPAAVCMRLQGLSSSDAVWLERDANTLALAGNAMSLCVL